MKTKMLTFLFVLGCCGFAFSQSCGDCPVITIDLDNPPAFPTEACAGDVATLCLDTETPALIDGDCVVTLDVDTDVLGTITVSGPHIGSQICVDVPIPENPNDPCTGYSVTVEGIQPTISVTCGSGACAAGTLGVIADIGISIITDCDANNLIVLLPGFDPITVFPNFTENIVPSTCAGVAGMAQLLSITTNTVCAMETVSIAGVENVCPATADTDAELTYDFTAFTSALADGTPCFTGTSGVAAIDCLIACSICPIIESVSMVPTDGCDAEMVDVVVTYNQDPTGLVTTDVNGDAGVIDAAAFTITYSLTLANTTCDPMMLDVVHAATCNDDGSNILDANGADTNGSLGMINVYPLYEVVVVQPECDGAAGSAEVQVAGVACATPAPVAGTAGVTNVCPAPAPGTPATLMYDFSADANIVAATAAGCAPTGTLTDNISIACDVDPCPVLCQGVDTNFPPPIFPGEACSGATVDICLTLIDATEGLIINGSVDGNAITLTGTPGANPNELCVTITAPINETCDPVDLTIQIDAITCADGTDFPGVIVGPTLVDDLDIFASNPIIVSVYPQYEVVVVQPECDGVAGSAEVQVAGVACATPAPVAGTAGVTNVCPAPTPGTPATLMYNFSADANIMAATAAGCAPTGAALVDDISTACDRDCNAVCEITDITAGMPVCAADGLTYDVTVTVTGTDASVTLDDGTGAIAATTTTFTFNSGAGYTITVADTDGVCAFGPFTDVDPACPVSACGITDITAGEPVCAADGLTYDVTVTVTGTDASVTLDDGTGAIAATTTTFTFNSGAGYTITVADTDALCAFGPFTGVDPACPLASPMATITDPCNCTNGIDTDDDASNGLELAAETITITDPAGAGETWTLTANNGELVEMDGMTPSSGIATDNGDGTYTFSGFVTADGVTIYTASFTNAAGDILMIEGGPCSPCFINDIPTVGEWGLIILGLMMSITAIVGIRQRREEEAYS